MSKFKSLILTFWLFGTAAHCQPSFAPVDTLQYSSAGTKSNFQIGNSYSIDFNRDGLDDLLFLKGNLITIRINSGLKSFGDELIVFQSTQHIYSISNFADINKDGIPDAAISDGKYITTLYGGTSSFTKAYQLNDPVYFGRLILLDFDKDGKIDLTYSNNNSIVLYSDVATGLIKKSTITTDLDGQIYDYAIRDLNADNQLDIVINSSGKKIKIQLGGTSQLTTILSKDTSFISEFEIGDLNLDGFLDIVYLEQNKNLYTLIYNSSSKTYLEQAVFAALPPNMFNFKLIDLRNNGTLDLAYNKFFSLYTRENNGLGQFQTENLLHESDIFIFDFTEFSLTNDEHKDLLTSSWNSFQITEFTSWGTHSLVISDGYHDDFSESLHADIDKDNFEDLISISRTGSVVIRWGSADYSYKTFSKYSIPLNARYGELADVDKDGNLDILFTIQSNSNSVSKMMILKGLGNRLFEKPKDWKYIYTSVDPLLLDVNKDEKLYLVTCGYYGELAWLDIENPDFTEYFSTTRKLTFNGTTTISMTSGDINNDGYPDLLMANYQSKNITILTNNKSGSFQESTLLPEGTVNEVTGIKSADLNNDQFEDLMVLVRINNTSSIQIFLNNQSNGFNYSTSLGLINMYQPGKINFLDLNDDKQLEFIVSSLDYGSTNIFVKEGSGFVNKGPDLIKVPTSGSRVYADLNNDKKPDVFTAGSFVGNSFIQINNYVKEPFQVESKINIVEVKTKSVKISFSATSSSGRLIVITKGNDVPSEPVDNRFYAANLQYGIGSLLGTNSYVIHSGDQNSLEISGLSSSTQYSISLFEFNTNRPQFTIINYTTSKEVKSFTTLNTPPQIGLINDQKGTNLEKISVPLTISDEDNSLAELTYTFTSSNSNVIPASNISVEALSTSPVLKIQPVADGDVEIEVIVKDPANNVSTAKFKYLSIIVGLEESNTQTFSVFPNPFNQEVNLIFDKTKNLSLIIYDAQGRVVKRLDRISDVIDLSDLPNGLYIVKTSDQQFVKLKKQ